MPYADRHDGGQLFQWVEKMGCWKTTEGRLVFVYPSTEDEPMWRVEVPSIHRIQRMSGKDAEKRVFHIANEFSKQKV